MGQVGLVRGISKTQSSEMFTHESVGPVHRRECRPLRCFDTRFVYVVHPTPTTITEFVIVRPCQSLSKRGLKLHLFRLFLFLSSFFLYIERARPEKNYFILIKAWRHNIYASTSITIFWFLEKSPGIFRFK